MTDIIDEQLNKVDDFPLKKEPELSKMTADEVLRVALELLRRVAPQVEAPIIDEIDEPSDFDYEGYCADMKTAVLAELETSLNHEVILYGDTFVVFAKKFSCKVQLSLNEHSMQPFSEIKERMLCVVKIVSWDIEAATEEDLVCRFMKLGAEMVNVSFVDDIRGNL